MNNQHEATIRWFFGRQWHTSMVFIVLGAFALGCTFGVFAMVPSWWRHRRLARRHSAVVSDTVDATVAPAAPPEIVLEHPPRDGL
ncbi:MAG TPA: LapA family protein [Burkholderiaceae bacterium]|nr:LapA family protein [Burkholderiaceae bacterium]